MQPANGEQIIDALLFPPVFVQFESAKLAFAQAVEDFTFSLGVEISRSLDAKLWFKLHHLPSYPASLLRRMLHQDRTKLEFSRGRSLPEPLFQLSEDKGPLFVRLLITALKTGVLGVKDGQAQAFALFIRLLKPQERLE